MDIETQPNEIEKRNAGEERIGDALEREKTESAEAARNL